MYYARRGSELLFCTTIDHYTICRNHINLYISRTLDRFIVYHAFFCEREKSRTYYIPTDRKREEYKETKKKKRKNNKDDSVAFSRLCKGTDNLSRETGLYFWLSHIFVRDAFEQEKEGGRGGRRRRLSAFCRHTWRIDNLSIPFVSTSRSTSSCFSSSVRIPGVPVSSHPLMSRADARLSK